MVEVRRLVFTKARIARLLSDLKNDKPMPAWAVDAKQRKGKLYIGDREVVPRETQQEWLRARLYDKTKPPISFSRDGGYEAIAKISLGVSRRAWYTFLSAQELHQKAAARPGKVKNPGQKIHTRGIVECDLIEARESDVAPFGRTKPTYICNLVDKLTSYMVCREVKTKSAKVVAKLLDQLFDEMEDAYGGKRKIRQFLSDDGGEFKKEVLELLKKRDIRKKVVPLGPAVESRNRFLQRIFYNLVKQKRGGKFGKLLEEARVICNQTKSRILKVSPEEALLLPDSQLAPRFNSKRAAPGKMRGPKISVGDTVRVLKKSTKGDVFFKGYRAKHYTSPRKVSKIKGRGYTVQGKSYPRQRLYKVSVVDTKSKALLQERGKDKRTAEDRARARMTATEKKLADRKKYLAEPRRGKRERKQKEFPGMVSS